MPRGWGTIKTFSYKVPDVNQIDKLACGFERAPHTILKMGTRPALLMNRNAQLLSDVTGSHVWIRFRPFPHSMPGFDCRLVYSGLVYFSGEITYKVYGKYVR